jgi:hypothetical protein
VGEYQRLLARLDEALASCDGPAVADVRQLAGFTAWLTEDERAAATVRGGALRVPDVLASPGR